ncbi:MAG: T9SS type A sorting domain-containing protein [Candidatus Eisenbacteria bacterium]|nr:T9SS type A sorting domain-containing protein [Candidatus Eisenbacteria bacterium]
MRPTSALVLLIPLLLCPAAWADTILVDLGGGGDFLTIGEGVAAAADGDTVFIAPGSYIGAGNRVINPGTKNLSIIGIAGADSTTIDCQASGRAFIFSGGQDSTTVVQGLTLTHGLSFSGGAVYCLGSSPTLQNCVFADNQSIGINTGGGGLCVDGGSSRITDCRFIDNFAGSGGGMATRGESNPVLEDVLFEGNGAISTGGLQCGSGSATLVNCTFKDNTADDSGGGLGLLGDGTYVVSNSFFQGNVSGDQAGGALKAENSTLSVSGCTFTDNEGSLGSSISCTRSDLEVTNTILAFDGGRAVYCSYTAATFSHCCLFGNEGGNGLPSGQTENLFVDPFFCARLHGDFTLYDVSPCLPANNEWGEPIGMLGQGCEHPGPPESPWGVSAISRVDTVFVGWRAVPDTLFDHYVAERDTSAVFGPYVVSSTTSDTTLVDAPLDDGIEYFYRVFAVDRFGVASAASETVSCFVALIPPGAPAGLAASVGHRTVKLSWERNPEPDLDYYRVYRGTAPGFVPNEPFATASEPSFSDTAVANYLSYYYRVAAVDFDDVESALSDEVRAVPHGIPPIITGLSAESGDSSAILTWAALDPACQEYFRVFRDTTVEMVSQAGLRDGFEQGEAGLPPSSPPWSVIEQSGTLVRVTASEHGVGERCLAVRDSSTGYARLFAYLGDGAAAPRVRFRARPGADLPGGGQACENLVQFELFGEDGMGYPAGVLEVCDGTLRHWVAGTDPETLGVCSPGEWHAIEWNLDCAADTYSVWLDGERVAADVPFFNDATEIEIFQIRTRPLEWGAAWIDEIMAGDHLEHVGTSDDTAFSDGSLMNGVTYYYKVSVVDTFGAEGPVSAAVSVVPGSVGVDESPVESGRAASLRLSRPNPFSSGTILSFTVPDPACQVEIIVYDVAGRVVRTLVDDWVTGGSQSVRWDGRTDRGADAASGVYFLSASIGDFRATRKVVLVR